MAPLRLDADSDGDLDLFVSSGGVEAEQGDPRLRDRLYRNDGQGRFSKAPNPVLPEARVSSGVAVAADFDRDGDLDLFVGGRVVPGQYPLTPASVLLRNDQGQFTDVTDQLAPGLRTVGLVTGALWSDFDDDEQADLFITCEWGPVRLFRNQDSKLAEVTGQAGLADHLGWWNGITGGDLDGDGDIDYTVTNFGLNTKYRADPEHPALLYYGPFLGEQSRLVEATTALDHRVLPVRGRTASIEAMPALAAKFPTFRAFAAADLESIYSAPALSRALRLEANSLETSVLFNLGNGQFEIRPLPILAQNSPAFGVAMTDFDGDGLADIYLVQNSFSPQPETGRMDGGLSLLLKGDGAGNLAAVGPKESGLLVPGDAKGLVTMDLERTGWPDLVISRNDQPSLSFRHSGSGMTNSLSVRLKGRAGNPTAVGAKVIATMPSGQQQAYEVYAGSGYLSQSSPVLFFGRQGGSLALKVRWPDGSSTEHKVEPSEHSVILAQQ